MILTDLRSQYLSRVRVTGAVRQPISFLRQAAADGSGRRGGVNEFATGPVSLYRRVGDDTSNYAVPWTDHNRGELE